MKFETDTFYLQQIMTGNVRAYAILVEKHKEMVFSIALKILHNREDAEEIAQDVFVKAYQSLANFKNEAKFSTWLYRIVYNTAISKVRRKKVELSPLDDATINNYSDDTSENQFLLSDDPDRFELLQKALKSLPEDENVIVSLFYQNDSSIEDISSVTGLTVANVKVKLHRIRKKLYTEMQRLMKSLEENEPQPALLKEVIR
ncbi:MAG: sigma-70 family RNA polymerase sigma factor [Bacteroidetes bacterium]|nr:sigma-70 family RNA polymerase sigma factor [Bacteroidota bacterium]